MNRFSTCLLALLPALSACTVEDVDEKKAPVDHQPAPTPVPATCHSVQLQEMGPMRGRDVAVTAHGVLLAKERALFRRSAPGARLEPVITFPEPRGPSSMVVISDRVIASVDSDCIQEPWGQTCSTNRVVQSDDGGDSWTDMSDGFPTELAVGVRLYGNAERLIATDYAGAMAGFDPETKSWSLLHPEPLDDTPGGHMVISVVGLDGGTILANDIYGGGVVALPIDGVKWAKIQGLGDWGYTGFATRGDKKVTANGGGFFATVDGVWTKTYEYPNGGLEIVDAGDSFLASDSYGKLLSSTDGVDWKVAFETEELVVQVPRLAYDGETLVWLGPGLQLSQDQGKTWSEVVAPVEDIASVVSRGGGVYARDGINWRFSKNDEWSSMPWSGLVSFDDQGVHVFDQAEITCSFYESGKTEPSRVTPVVTKNTVRDIFASSKGLFVSTLEVWDESCNAAVRAGLLRLDTASGQLIPATEGLPYVDVSSSCRQYWRVKNLTEVKGVLFAAMEDDFDTMAVKTFRSVDGAESWSEVANDSILTAADDGHGIVALFSSGDLFRSFDGGATFEKIPAPPGEGAIVDVVTLNGRLVVSRRSNTAAALWTTRDGSVWTEVLVDALGPVQDMDVRDGKLWLATSTSGVWELSGACLEQI